MTRTGRVEKQAAYVLHHRPFRDSSLLLDVIARDHGKLALIARGARSAKARLKPILRPFMPLKLSWVQRSDLGTLTGAELDGGPRALTGDALLSGYYANELILNFLHRHDPQPEVFAIYERTISKLASTRQPAAALREFEIELLRLLGYALNFDHEATSGDDLADDSHYEYRAEQGPVKVARSEGSMVFTGATLTGIGEGRFDDDDILRAAARLLRQVIAHHLDGKELQSRKVLVDLRRSRAKIRGPREGKTL